MTDITLNEILSSYSFYAVGIGSVVLVVLSAISLLLKKETKLLKKILFLSIVFTAISVTAFLGFSTIYLNVTSVSKGPVHHHADFEVWDCGQELDLIDPTGLSNKIGTPTLHEHNDKRIHLEGVIMTPKDESLGRFFNVIGGRISNYSYSFPTNSGIVTRTTGDMCGRGVGEVQVFVYKTNGKFYSQEKIKDPLNYIIAPESSVPPGDCIIVEFDTLKSKTDKLCRSYKVSEETKKIEEKVHEH